jgi:undecaprenyl diphosphate synthase
MKNSNYIPNHVAIIMDGNGRWAEQRGLPRADGHRAGVKAVNNIVEESIRQGVKYLTLFCFSTENWLRPEDEISSLMGLLRLYLQNQLHKFHENKVRLHVVGDLSKLSDSLRSDLEKVITETSDYDKFNLVLAISYGGREDIVNACKAVAHSVARNELKPEEISSEILSEHLWTKGIPDPDLLIRTSGEIRISNFLLWQLAYSEIVITDECWPDFDESVFDKCLIEYAQRERRYGVTSAQIKTGIAIPVKV